MIVKDVDDPIFIKLDVVGLGFFKWFEFSDNCFKALSIFKFSADSFSLLIVTVVVVVVVVTCDSFLIRSVFC